MSPRPEEYINPFPAFSQRYDDFKAGANAYKEALKKEGIPIKSWQSWDDPETGEEIYRILPATNDDECIGWLSFILKD